MKWPRPPRHDVHGLNWAGFVAIVAFAVILFALAIGEKQGFGCKNEPKGPTIGGVIRLYGCP